MKWGYQNNVILLRPAPQSQAVEILHFCHIPTTICDFNTASSTLLHWVQRK